MVNGEHIERNKMNSWNGKYIYVCIFVSFGVDYYYYFACACHANAPNDPTDFGWLSSFVSSKYSHKCKHMNAFTILHSKHFTNLCILCSKILYRMYRISRSKHGKRCIINNFLIFKSFSIFQCCMNPANRLELLSVLLLFSFRKKGFFCQWQKRVFSQWYICWWIKFLSLFLSYFFCEPLLVLNASSHFSYFTNLTSLKHWTMNLTELNAAFVWNFNQTKPIKMMKT